MEDIAATLKAMRRGTLVPQIYNRRYKIEGACEAGKIFACKGHTSALVLSGVNLSIGIALSIWGIFALIESTWPWEILLAGTLFIVFGMFQWAEYRVRALIVGPVGIFTRSILSSFFVAWDQILNVELKPIGIYVTTVGKLLDFTIANEKYSTIDRFPFGGVTGYIQALFEIINDYFRWIRSHQPTKHVQD